MLACVRGADPYIRLHPNAARFGAHSVVLRVGRLEDRLREARVRVRIKKIIEADQTRV